MNGTDDPTKVHCSNCGHRADLPRSECDCPKCTASPEQRKEQAQKDMVDLLKKFEANGGDLNKVLNDE